MFQSKIHEVPATMAVDAGLINQEFLDEEQERFRCILLSKNNIDFLDI